MTPELFDGDVSPRPGRHVEGVDHEVGGHRPRRLPPDDLATKDVGDEGHVDNATPGGAVGEIGDPQLVGSGGAEVAVDEVGCAHRRLISVGGEALLGARCAHNLLAFHETLDLIASNLETLPGGCLVQLAASVDAVVGPPDLLQLRAKFAVFQRSLRRRSRLGGVVGGWGDLQLFTDRLDSPRQPTGRL